MTCATKHSAGECPSTRWDWFIEWGVCSTLRVNEWDRERTSDTDPVVRWRTIVGAGPTAAGFGIERVLVIKGYWTVPDKSSGRVVCYGTRGQRRANGWGSSEKDRRELSTSTHHLRPAPVRLMPFPYDMVRERIVSTLNSIRPYRRGVS